MPKHFSLVLSLCFLAACAGKQLEPSVVKSDVLRRGWAYVDPEQDLFQQETGGPDVNFTTAAIIGNRLIYGSARFGLMSMNKETGRVLWRKNVPGGIYANVLASGNRLFVG